MMCSYHTNFLNVHYNLVALSYLYTISLHTSVAVYLVCELTYSDDSNRLRAAAWNLPGVGTLNGGEEGIEEKRAKREIKNNLAQLVFEVAVLSVLFLMEHLGVRLTHHFFT